MIKMSHCRVFYDLSHIRLFVSLYADIWFCYSGGAYGSLLLHTLCEGRAWNPNSTCLYSFCFTRNPCYNPCNPFHISFRILYFHPDHSLFCILSHSKVYSHNHDSHNNFCFDLFFVTFWSSPNIFYCFIFISKEYLFSFAAQLFLEFVKQQWVFLGFQFVVEVQGILFFLLFFKFVFLSIEVIQPVWFTFIIINRYYFLSKIFCLYFSFFYSFPCFQGYLFVLSVITRLFFTLVLQLQLANSFFIPHRKT